MRNENVYVVVQRNISGNLCDGDSFLRERRVGSGEWRGDYASDGLEQLE